MQKPRLSFWEVWNMSFGFLGIQFGFALQNANVSRIFETLGARVENIPILWIAAPVTGLVVQPIVGYFSDRTWNRLGRRRPYFLGGAILASLALLAMPNSPALWVAAGMLWIMDASINISMEPFRAFVGDNLPSAQRTIGFAMQSFFIGVGAVVASLLPWLLTKLFGVSNQAPEHMIPASVRLSFYVGAAVFFAAVVWTVFRSREYSPEEMASFDENQARETTLRDRRTPDEYAANGGRQILIGVICIVAGAAFSYWLNRERADQVMILSVGIGVVGLLLVVGGLMQRLGRYDNGFITILNDFQDMPRTMKQLAWVQFFSWFALFAMWIYTTPGVTAHIYHTTDTTSALYNEGANWVGVGFGVYNGVAALVAFVLPVLARQTSRKVDPRHVPGHRRAGARLDRRHQAAGAPAGLHGGRGHCLGQHPLHAVRHPHRIPAAVEDGLLHGGLQFLHRHSTDRRRSHPGLLRRSRLRWAGHVRASHRRHLPGRGRGVHPARGGPR